MSVRRETIILELEDNASGEALRAAAAFKALDRSISGLSGSSSRTRVFQTTARDVDKMGSSFDRAGSTIDSFSGRVGLLGTALMAIGPAIIPIGAAAIPAIATLAAGMGAAAGAAGVLALAFTGVGDAVSAVSDYRLEPTAANLAKVQQAMEALGPAGAQFVMTLDRISPALEDLQQRAGAGIFPGFDRGLNQMMTELPAVRNLVSDLSVTVGTLGEASANALTNDADWQEFFEHIGTDGAAALENFGRATGNFTAGVANVLEALTGIGGGSDGLIEASRAFREWADNLEHTEGFQEFADYVRESGPQVAEFLAATGDAMVGLVNAAAPWGAVVLPALTATADVFAAIASSPVGPPLFAAAAAMLAFNRASALMGPGLSRMNTSLGSARTNISGFGRDVGAMSREFSNLNRAQSSALSFFSGTSAAAQRTRSSLAEVGRSAAGAAPAIAAVAALSTGAADKVGLTNTAMLGLAGSMIGPWGAAAGATVGLLVDVAQANDDVVASIQRVSQVAASGGGLEDMNKQLEKARTELTAFRNEMGQGTVDSKIAAAEDDFWGIGGLKAGLDQIKGIFGDSGVEEAEKEFGKAQKSVKATEEAVRALAEAFDVPITGDTKQQIAALDSVLGDATPAMSALGISADDLAAAAAKGDGSLGALVGRIGTWQSTADSTAGRTDAVGDAIEQLGNDAISTAASADALAAALAGVIGPGQSLIAAQDAMSSALNGLDEKIHATNKSLLGTSDAAIQNRAAISGTVTEIQNLSTAQAAAGESSLTIATTMSESRQAMIDQGVAAGLSRTQVEALVNEMGLTPDVVRTAFEAAGIEDVDAKTQALTARYQSLPKKLQTDIATNGIPKSEADIQRLTAKYNLTPKQVETLARLMDNASGPIAAVIAALRAADGQSATTTIRTEYITTHTVITNQAAGVRANMAFDADGGFHENGVRAFADGGFGMDGKYYSRQPMIIPGGANILWGEKETGWEAYISGKPGERDRNLEILELAAERLGAAVIPAANGRITAYAKGGSSGGGRSGGGKLSLEKALERHGMRLEKSLGRAEKAVDRAKDRLDHWGQKRDEVRSEVTGSLTKDWFNSDRSAWSGMAAGGTAAYAQQQWRQQGKNSRQLSATIANLVKNGAGDAFIREILGSEDPLAAAQMFNKQTKAGMRQSQKLFLSATRATASAANYTSGVVYGDEQRAATRELRTANKRLTGIEKAVKRNHKEAQESRKKNGAGKATSSGSRARTRSKRG